ncbi:transglycosylase SLT domain-containing protein [Streptosporangium sp. NPDC000563]|uniref:aggregation-promoting factor C-terminal-like domain-containing protein n=1 Tax=Streptosporangium sp. NPDC000563 TaxID=3154366 RepID=UPI00331D00DE
MSTLRRTGVLVITSVLALGTTTVAQASSARAGNQAVAKPLVSAHGWNKTQFNCLRKLWSKESNWNHRALNRSSGAYGIPQALPAGKMATAGRDWRTNPRTQIKWGLGYIKQRYGSPCQAWNHSLARGWY